HIALDVPRLFLVQRHGVWRERLAIREIGGQFAHAHFDAPDGFARRLVVERRDGGDRLTAVAHLVACQRIFGARDRQHAEALVAIRTGDDGDDAGDAQRIRNVDIEDLGMRIGAAIDAAGELVGCDNIGGVLRAAGYLLRSVDHRHVAADIVGGQRLVHVRPLPFFTLQGRVKWPYGESDFGHHGAIPSLPSAAAYFTASMIFT